MRIEPQARVGEFREVGAPDNHRAGVSQPRNHCRIALSDRRANAHPRTPKSGHAGFVKQILDRNRDTGQWMQTGAGAAHRVDPVCLGQRRVAIDANEGARTLACGIIDRSERSLYQFPAAELVRGQPLR